MGMPLGFLWAWGTPGDGSRGAGVQQRGAGVQHGRPKVNTSFRRWPGPGPQPGRESSHP